MPCGCSKNRMTADLVRTFDHAFPSTNDTGTIETFSSPNCTSTYNGPFRRVSVYVVGYGTPDETFFLRKHRNKAIAKARDGGLTFDEVPAGAVCAEDMVTLFGS